MEIAPKYIVYSRGRLAQMVFKRAGPLHLAVRPIRTQCRGRQLAIVQVAADPIEDSSSGTRLAAGLRLHWGGFLFDRRWARPASSFSSHLSSRPPRTNAR